MPEDLCGTSGAHAGFATSAEVVTVVSSSANDASAGTGARTVKITGLNSSWEEQSETITLNGTTSVDSTNTYLRVYGFEVLTAGSGGVTAGAITIAQKVTTANIFLVIAAGLNKEYSSQYTIPKGKTGYVVQVWGKVRKGTSSTVDGFVLYRTNNGLYSKYFHSHLAMLCHLIDICTVGLSCLRKQISWFVHPLHQQTMSRQWQGIH